MTPAQASPPPDEQALHHPPTAQGLRLLIVKRRLWLFAVVLVGAISILLAMAQSRSQMAGLLLINAVCYPPCLLAAGLALRRTKRLTKVLETYPWRAYPCAYPRRSLESPKSIEIRFTHAYMPVLRITWYSGNLARKRNPSPQTIWFAGDPRYGGVVSPVGGHFPVRVVPEASAQAVSGGGTEEADVLAERAGLVTGGRMHTT